MRLKLLFGDPLDVGTKAPEFDLADQTGTRHSLSKYLGKWVIVYFYPRDNTTGCTAEACSFRDEIGWFHERGVKVIGISADGVDSHKKFAETHSLPFPILADPTKQTCKDFGVISPLGFAHRITFLIDPQGVIADRIEWASWKEYAKIVERKLESRADFKAG